MRHIFGLTAAAFCMSAMSALAQLPADPPPPGAAPPKAPPEISAENPPPGRRDPDRPERPERPERPAGKHEWRLHARGDRPPPPTDDGARFQISQGRTKIDLRCAQGDSTRECGDVLLQILDRLQAPSSGEGDSNRSFRDRGDDRDRFERR